MAPTGPAKCSLPTCAVQPDEHSAKGYRALFLKITLPFTLLNPRFAGAPKAAFNSVNPLP
jgi:hypothetical protein